MKKLILVTSPPACGKTFVTRKLAKAMPNCVYLDKDTLITLSKQIFVVANQEYNRSSDFFEAEIRNPEYDCVMELAMEALEYNDTVFINAPYTREVRTPGYMENLRQELLKKKGAELVVVWVQCDKEVCRQRMIHRNSDRDTWKLENWDEYINKIDLLIPEKDPCILYYFIVDGGWVYEGRLQEIKTVLSDYPMFMEDFYIFPKNYDWLLCHCDDGGCMIRLWK